MLPEPPPVVPPGDPPTIRFIAIQPNGLPACNPALPCTIPFGVPFAVRFVADRGTDAVAGYQWQTTWPGEEIGPYEPLCDTLQFVAAAEASALVLPSDPIEDACPRGGAFYRCELRPPGSPTDTLWSVLSGIVTAKYGMRLTPNPGRFRLQARGKDSVGRVGEFVSASFIINYDPDTRLERIAACDCPAPPPNCASRDSVPVGWVTGLADRILPVSEWRRFCPGDTVAPDAMVRFFVHGRDDPRDGACDPAVGRMQPGFAYRYEWERLDRSNHNVPFSSKWTWGDQPHPLGTWQGGSIAWRVCPFDYTFLAAAVDELNRFDGSPDSIRFSVGHPPAIDSVQVPHVIVLAPTCPASVCVAVPAWQFGPDTSFVAGSWVEDNRTPLHLGANEFVLPFRGFGQDHRLDRGDPALPSTQGSIRAWSYAIDCPAGCGNLEVPGARNWWTDFPSPPIFGQSQVFDEMQPVVVPLDTLSVNGILYGVLASFPQEPLEFELQARDTSAEFHLCSEPSDLGPFPHSLDLDIHEIGLTSAAVQRPFVLRELRQVRPWPPAAGSAPATPAPSSQ